MTDQVVLTNLPVSLQEEMARQLANLSKRIAAPSGNKIRIQSKRFKFPDGTETDGHFQAVIVDFIARNDFYEGAYDPDDKAPPACFAIGEEREMMVPSEKSPEKQGETCSACPMGAWGSGTNGKGKACKNSYLLALLPPDAAPDHPIWTLQVSPTALKFFDDYVAGVKRDMNTIPLGVITTIGLDPNQTYATLRFGRPAPNPRIAEFFARQAQAREILLAEPDVSGFGQNVKPMKRAGNRR